MTTPVSTVGSTTGTTSATSSTSSTDRSQLSSQAFLQLLVAQLQYQDPSQPMDTATLMNQTATINQIQTMQQLTAASTAQLQSQNIQNATTMVGRTVGYTDPSGATVTGYVSSASLSGSTPTVHVGSVDVDLSAVTEILSGVTSAPTTTS